MIAKAKSISHGHAYLDYIKGESRNKKHPEKIFHIAEHGIPGFICSQGVREAVCAASESHTRKKNNLIRIVVSPLPEHTGNFTLDDWKKLWLDFASEFDKIQIKDEKTGKIYSPRTNILGSIHTVELHLESESGIPTSTQP